MDGVNLAFLLYSVAVLALALGLGFYLDYKTQYTITDMRHVAAERAHALYSRETEVP